LQSVEGAIEAARSCLSDYERFVNQAATEGTLTSTHGEPNPESEGGR
jgi:hypothetical protein